jgi:hypothetical protein
MYVELTVDSVGKLSDSQLMYKAPEARATQDGPFSRSDDDEEIDFENITFEEITPEEWPGNTEFTLAYDAILGLWIFEYVPAADFGIQVEGSDLEEVCKCVTLTLKNRIGFAIGDEQMCIEDFDEEFRYYLQPDLSDEGSDYGTE